MKTSVKKCVLGLFAVALLCGSVGISGAAAQSSTKKSSSTGASGAIDLNTASEKDLDSLPGVGPATAKKIIAGRPYSSVDDLSKAGVSAATVKKITPLVTIGSAPATTASSKPSKPASAASTAAATPPPAAKPAAASAAAKPAAAAPASSGTPGPGMVWVNLESGTYHYSSSRYYGKTKSGKYMSEADAMKAGYHAAKNEKKPQ